MFPQIENTEIRITEEARIHFIDTIFDQLLHDEIEYKDVFNLVFYNPPSPMNRQKTVAKLMKPLITMVNNWSPANTFIMLWELLQEIIGYNSAGNIVDCINDVFYGYNLGLNKSLECRPEVYQQTSVQLYFMATILSRYYTNSLTEELELI